MDKTIHELAIDKLHLFGIDGDLKRKGFSKALCNYLEKKSLVEGISEDVKEYFEEFGRIIPDGFYETEEAFCIIEVEDSHRLSVKKLEKYLFLWECIDSATHWPNIKLFVTDRYGMNLSEINLCQHYYIYVTNNIDKLAYS